ncbi:MAG: hypothetical protein WD431_24695 [Cyclobacteriaceae bacterium]
MAEQISAVLGKQITYQSPNLISFFMRKRREGVPGRFIFVMIMLHYFPRLQKSPAISEAVTQITGDLPIDFKEFVEHNRTLFY